MAVQVHASVQRIHESMQPGAVAHVIRGGGYAQHVVRLQPVELDAAAVEGGSWQLLGVQLDALDRGADELDEGAGAGLVAGESDRGVRGERLGPVGEIQTHVIARLRHDRGSRPRLLTREVVASSYVSTLSGASGKSLTNSSAPAAGLG